MKYLMLMLAMAVPAFAQEVNYNPDDYYIDYLTPTAKDESLIVYENIHTGYVMKILVKTKTLQDPEAIRAIKIKVATENARH